MNNIINLVKLFYNTAFSMKKYSILMIIMAIIMPFNGKAFISFGSGIIIIWLNYSLLAYEDKSKMNNLINSLPVSSKEYILSRYIYGFINIIIGIIFSDIMFLVLKTLNKISSNDMTIETLNITVLIIGLIAVNLIIPIALIVGFTKGRIALVFLAVFPICFSNNIGSLIINLMNNVNESIIRIIAIFTGIIFTVASYLITNNLYSKKDIE